MSLPTMSTEIVAADGACWTLRRLEPYQRKDGTATELKVWSRRCRTCGEDFEIKTPVGVAAYAQSTSFGLVNCERHRTKRRRAQWRKQHA